MRIEQGSRTHELIHGQDSKNGFLRVGLAIAGVAALLALGVEGYNTFIGKDTPANPNRVNSAIVAAPAAEASPIMTPSPAPTRRPR
jgi:hypothetical protein